MHKVSNDRDVALLWVHNKKTHPEWLDSIMVGKPQFVWWDVGWSIAAKPNLPCSGYIYTKDDQVSGVTHETLIVEIDKSPTEQHRQEVIDSWKKSQIHYNENSPLLLGKQESRCTLLKLENLHKLEVPMALNEFVFVSTGKSPESPPRAHYKVKLKA
jgi:hypothetical protein